VDYLCPIFRINPIERLLNLISATNKKGIYICTIGTFFLETPAHRGGCVKNLVRISQEAHFRFGLDNNREGLTR